MKRRVLLQSVDLPGRYRVSNANGYQTLVTRRLHAPPIDPPLEHFFHHPARSVF
jgi:hypothetical protein